MYKAVEDDGYSSSDGRRTQCASFKSKPETIYISNIYVFKNKVYWHNVTCFGLQQMFIGLLFDLIV